MAYKFAAMFLMLLSTTQVSAYYTQRSKIWTEDSTPVVINGISWSGFQDTNVLQGLQSNPLYAMTTKNHAYGMLDILVADAAVSDTLGKLPLFKTVRIPIQPGVLYDDSNAVDLNLSATDSRIPTQGNGLFCKNWATNWTGCQTPVSSKEAFWTFVTELQRHNMRAIIDMHHRYGYGDNMRDGTVYDISQYQQDISFLADQIKQKGLDNVLGIDIFNEPYQLNWFTTNNNQVPWTKVIATAANAVYANNPSLLLFVEGPDQGSNDPDTPPICVAKANIVDDQNAYSHSTDPAVCGDLERLYFKGNWGEDFKPLLNQLSAKNGIAVFDRDKLSTELTKQGIKADALIWLLGDDSGNKAHIVFSPHVYPAEVAGWESAPGAPSNLRFNWTWGFLSNANYPVVLGEASWKTASGKAFIKNALMPYLQSNMQTNNVFFWAIGFLGDTVTAIDPHTGELNEDVWTTLKPYFLHD